MRMGLILIRYYHNQHQPVRGRKSGHSPPTSMQRIIPIQPFSFLSPLTNQIIRKIHPPGQDIKPISELRFKR